MSPSVWPFVMLSLYFPEVKTVTPLLRGRDRKGGDACESRSRGGRRGPRRPERFGPAASILRDPSLMRKPDTDVCVFGGSEISLPSAALWISASAQFRFQLPPHPGDAGRLGFMRAACFMVMDIIFK